MIFVKPKIFQCIICDTFVLEIFGKSVDWLLIAFSNISSKPFKIPQAFKPFTTHDMAKETLKTLATGEMNPFISDFVETYYPSSKSKTFLAVQDNRLAAAISSNLGISCKMNDAVSEQYRGIRYHFGDFLKGNEGTESMDLSQACLGLGHAVSRDSIQFDVNRQDKGIINSYCLIDQMEKNLNTFAMRTKEWYGWHFPELSKIVTENEAYVRVASYHSNAMHGVPTPLPDQKPSRQERGAEKD